MARPHKTKCPYCATVPDGMVCDACGGEGMSGPCRTKWEDGAATLVCVLPAGHKGNHADERGWKFSDEAARASKRFMAKQSAAVIHDAVSALSLLRQYSS